MNDRKYMDCEMDKELSIRYQGEKGGKSSDEISNDIFNFKYTEAYVRDHIAIDDLNMGLRLVCYECRVSLGWIDILCENSKRDKIPIEIKKGIAGDCAVGQILGYMKSVHAEEGIIIAKSFSKRLLAIFKDYNIKLFYYIPYNEYGTWYIKIQPVNISDIEILRLID